MYQTTGVNGSLPIFHKRVAERLTFPLSWLSGTYEDFKEWRKTARAKVKEAYAKMHKVWQSQNALDRLKTKIWDVPHEFNAEMQDEAFEWLDRQLRK